MCTLSLIRTSDGGFRIAFNRDELRVRAPGEPPSIRDRRGLRVVAPRDPDGGGTWIAVNDRGIAAAVLNGNPPAERRRGLPGGASRGVIVEAAAAEATLDAALDALSLAAEPVRRPFRAFLTDGRDVVVAAFDPGHRSGAVVIDRRDWDGRPMMLGSSGIGDHLVEGPRRAHFEQSVVVERDEGDDSKLVAAQSRFHDSTTPLRDHIAVRMSRPEARTVSRSVVEIDRMAAVARFHHEDLEEDGSSTPSSMTTIVLPLAGRPA